MRQASKVIKHTGYQVVAYVSGTDLKYDGVRGFSPLIAVFDRKLMRGEISYGR